MKLTMRGRYAVAALAELARRGDGACVCLADIAEAQGLSAAYLEQVFQPLRSAGFVCGARGRGGGYTLCRPAADIDILSIVEAVGETFDATACAGRADCRDGEQCDTHDFWTGLSEHVRAYLRGQSLADIAAMPKQSSTQVVQFEAA